VSQALSSLSIVLCLAGVLGIVHPPMAGDVRIAVDSDGTTAVIGGSITAAPQTDIAREQAPALAMAASETVRIATRTFNPNSLALGEFGDLDQQ
jgi:hypothetical protein